MPNFQNPMDALQQWLSARQLPTVPAVPVYSYTPMQNLGQTAPSWLNTFQNRLRARTLQQQNTPRFSPVLYGGFSGPAVQRPLQPLTSLGMATPARPRPQTY